MVRITLDKYLAEHGITRYELAKRTDIKFQIIDNYYKNRVVRYDSYILDRICSALSCNIGDIIEYSSSDVDAIDEEEGSGLSKGLE
jgi:putative transcriptional regulator